MFSSLLHSIRAKAQRANKKPFIIAISGFGGSGKSTLAGKVAASLSNVIPAKAGIQRSSENQNWTPDQVRGDDERKDPSVAPFPQDDKKQEEIVSIIPLDHFITHRLAHRDEDWRDFDRGRFRREVLVPAREGQPITYGVYSWPDDAITRQRAVPQTKYLIVEGCSLFHPDLLPYYDFTIWIDMPLEESMRRGMARDKALGADHDDKWQNIWMPNDRDFFRKYNPEQAADFVYGNKPLV